jgi:hypothetical protein
MTKTRPIRFAEFRALIERVGFVEKRVPKGRVFKHPEQGLLLFRDYGDEETVEQHDLVYTRKFLDLRGVLAADEFDAALLRASTPA